MREFAGRLPAALILLAAAVAFAETEPDAGQILAECDRAMGFESMYGESTQVITTTGGKTRELKSREWAVNSGEKQLAEYIAPADIRGQRILMTDYGDNIWMFNPETRRTRKLGSHMRKRKVMGSDFTYEDQAGGRISEKYRGECLGREEIGRVECHVLELRPTPQGPSYEKLKAWIGAEDYIIRRLDYFETGGKKPLKRLLCTDLREVDGKLVAHELTMTNLLDDTKTIVRIAKLRFDAKIPGSIFEARNLGK